LGATDTITWGGDNSRSGYQDNHNLDPSIVGSANFGQIFRTPLPGNYKGIGPEQVFSQPLVFTGGDGIQHVYIATTQNNIYKLDVKTGEILLQRNLHVPFLTADLDGCVDINPAVGVTATGVIDPATGIWYVLAKTYSEAYQNNVLNPAQPPGRLKGRYYFHAIHTETLAEVQGFPINLEGLLFRNNKNRMFLGGNQHARPGFLQMGDFIYTGFASHCVQYNFTGAIIGFNKNTGAIVEAFATQGGIEPNSIPGGGVWMSGGGIASDGQGSMFFSTGNGYASQLKEDGAPVPGRQPPTALEEAAVNAKVNDDGTITIVDFFMPWEKVQLDGADKDLGTTPLQLLPSQFACPNVRRMGVVTGKSGKTYWLDINNLGGYQMGPNKQDAVPQVYQNENSVYAGAGIYPLDGGYVYVNVIQFQTHVFKFSCNSQGNPQFSLVANTPEKNAYVLGTGHGTTTSLNGQPGTGLLWVSDVEGINLRIYKAVPDGGSMTLIKGFDIPGVVKFTRPVFGDGRVYIGTQGYVYGFGSPVNLPLNCSSPYDFGTTPVDGASTPRTIRCIANIATQVIGIGLTSGRDFVLSGLPTVPFQLAQGAALTFQAAFTPKSVGPLAGQVLVNTTNPIAGYSIFTPITLKGTANSPRPVLSISPKQVNFTTIVGENPNGVVGSTIFSNLGDSPLTINNITYSLVSERGPWVTPVVTGGGVQVGPFTFSDLPTTISGGSSVTVEINYNPKTAGNNVVYAQINTDGGSAFLDVFGTASTYPGALVEFENADGSGWTRYQEGVPFSFGSVLRSQTKTLRLRVTNSGTASAAPLSITVSKPPFGVGGIIGAVNNIDLAEGASIPAGQSATASLFCSVPGSQVNLPSYGGSASWTMNTGDPNLGKLFMSFTCTAVTEQLGPRLQNGTAQYGYVGCFKENNPERQLAIMAYGDQGNENGRCINACFSLNYRFAATQYQSECWCGNAIPNDLDPEEDCNYLCSGNRTQTCGGDGYFHNQAHMSLFADKLRFDGNTTAEPIHIVQSVGRYNYLGCYSENNGKAFNQKVTATDAMTTQFCADFCGAYDYFGLEYASECYCGTTLNAAVATKVTDGQCNMACKGTNSEYCGAGSRMQVYKANGTAPTTSTSVTSAPTSSVRTTASSAPGTTSSSTRPASIRSTTSSTPLTSSRPTTSSTPLTSARTASTSTSSARPVALATVSSYTHQGCYTEGTSGRALPALSYTNTTAMSPTSCASFCTQYAWFGVENGKECYCGPYVKNGAQNLTMARQGECSYPCSGNKGFLCGGNSRINMY
ncbi:Pyrrolo-quinoline quinone, partial [Patellaria atrata CBS 101060]